MTPHPAGDYRAGVGAAIRELDVMATELRHVADNDVLVTNRDRARAAIATVKDAQNRLRGLL